MAARSFVSGLSMKFKTRVLPNGGNPKYLLIMNDRAYRVFNSRVAAHVAARVLLRRFKRLGDIPFADVTITDEQMRLLHNRLAHGPACNLDASSTPPRPDAATKRKVAQ